MSSADDLKNIIDNHIETLLKDVAKEEGFETYKIEKALGSMKGDGYLGVITAVFITGKNKSGQSRILHLIVKSASKSDAVRIETPLATVYEREIYMYNTVIPAFNRREEKRNLRVSSNVAKCYKACMIEKSEALIFENLKNSGYSMWDKRLPMEHDHVSLVMAEFGRFHGKSLAMKNQEPEEFKILTDNLCDIYDAFMEKADYTKTLINQCKKALDSLDPVADEKSYATFKTFIDEQISVFFKNMSQYVDEYSVILHGDCHTNNMMFKYDDKDNSKKPSEMCLIDFQIARLGPSVFDLSYFLYSSGSKVVLDNHEHYLNVYHDNLSMYLRRFGCDPDKIYPYKIFQNQWKKYSKFGLMSLLVIHLFLSKQDEVTDLTEIAESGKSVTDAFDYNISNLEVYNNRARHIILHFVSNGYI